MIQDDKIGIGYGLLGLFQDDAGFVTFDGKKWTLNDVSLAAHLAEIAKAGANFVRILPWGVWGSHPGQKKPYQFQPYFLDTSRDKWDLSMFNTYYFPIVEKVFTIANSVGLTILWDLFDNCQFHGGYKKWSPWVNNIQDVESFYEPDADQYSRHWIATWLIRAERNGWDIIWGWGNEMNNLAFPDFAKRIIFPYVKAKKLDFNRMTYGATTKIGPTDSIQDQVRNMVEDTFGKAAERAIIMEDHGYPFTASLPVWGKKPWRKLYSDDGLHPRPIPTQWGARAKYILNYAGDKTKFVNFEHLPEAYPMDLAFDVATIGSIFRACRTK